MAVEQHHTYCAMCISRCGVIATVDDGVLKSVNADPAHPNGCICVKGTAAPEIVYSPDRLKHPMKRTRPKGDKGPGWVRISWEEALATIAKRLQEAKSLHGPESVVFGSGTPSAGAISDAVRWVDRLANAFGSPNRLGPLYVCNWHRTWGAQYTYGVPTPTPDYDNARCIMLWGFNPYASWPAAATRISRARARGAKLIVIDPRKSNMAEKADLWLQVRPGCDGALALGMIHVMLEENLMDVDFTRRWTNGPFLVRDDNQQLLTARDISADDDAEALFVWDERGNDLVGYRSDRGYFREGILPALSGSHAVSLIDGTVIECRSALSHLAKIAEAYAPEKTEKLTGVSAWEVRRAVRMFATAKPSCYYSWVGIEQNSDATQTNRALCVLYALTGQFDERGSNIIFSLPQFRDPGAPDLLPKEIASRRLGRDEYPLGSPGHGNLVQPRHLYRAILTGEPYPVKALLSFGGDLLLAEADAAQGAAALRALDFYAQVDMFPNPSASFADLLLPASTCWEREGLMPGFVTAEETASWVQLRPAVVEPLHESRADLEIVFGLATRLGLGEHFFNGDIDTALNWHLAPSGLDVEKLREQRIGIRVAGRPGYRKYAELDTRTGQPQGFHTPTRKLEIFSTRLAKGGYPPFPGMPRRCDNDGTQADESNDHPLILTSFRLVQFCDQQHRNIPRLRKQAREPLLEINPLTAVGLGIEENEVVVLETHTGKIHLKARFNSGLKSEVVATQYGWWQGCEALRLPGYDPLSPEGANINLIIPFDQRDPISGAVAHRSQRCRVSKEIPQSC
jgi:anaerobic selenocysteine-containing dehydrogenase